jgi:hypothetical protein
MAGKKKVEVEDKGNENKGQGRAVTLPNGVRRIDFIRDAYYKDGKSRSDIRKEINEMLEGANRGDEAIPYQIVFASTKTEEDPRIAAAAAKADKGSE